MPTKLELNKTSAEVKHGATISYIVTLKNGRGQIVPATEDVPVEISTNKGAAQRVTISQGQSSASFNWTANVDGMMTLTVRSGKLLPASCLVLVVGNAAQAMALTVPVARLPVPLAAAAPQLELARPGRGRMAIAARDIARSPASVAASPAEGPDAPVPPPAAVAVPAPAGTQGLAVFVRPDTVYGDAQSLSWQAQVMVAVQNPQGDLSPVSNDTTVFLTPNIGQLASGSVTIHHGDATTFNSPVTLTSTRSGTDSILAVSELGKGSAQVVYQMPQASQLRLGVGGAGFDVNGTAVLQAAVCLVDNANNIVEAASDVPIRLNTTMGDPPFSDAVVSTKQPCSPAIKFGSRNAGAGKLTATSLMGLKPDTAEIVFPAFPWYLVWLAIVGGLVGAFASSYNTAKTAGWWSQLWPNLLLGAMFGGVAYLFACYGALVLPKSVPVTLQNVPTATRVGAFLFGFVGGFLGRKWWTGDSGDSGKEQPKAA